MADNQYFLDREVTHREIKSLSQVRVKMRSPGLACHSTELEMGPRYNICEQVVQILAPPVPVLGHELQESYLITLADGYHSSVSA